MRLAGRNWINQPLIVVEDHEDRLAILTEQVKAQSSHIQELEKKLRWYQDRLDSAKRKLKG